MAATGNDGISGNSDRQYNTVPTPKEFDFAKPQEWPNYIRRFNRYRVVSGLETKEERIQITTLLYTMGDAAEDIIASFGLTDSQATNYDEVVRRLDNHFIPKRNVIYERAKFNQRNQQEGESVDTFVTELYALTKYCEYGSLKEEMIRDRLVVGLRDLKLSESLQLDCKLTLEIAANKARQSEAVKAQQSMIRASQGESKARHTEVIDAIQANQLDRPTYKNKTIAQAPNSYRQDKRNGEGAKRCSRCNYKRPHPGRECPARNSTCFKCKGKGHYASRCKAQETVLEVAETDDEEELYMGTIDSGSKSTPWRAKVNLNGQIITFKLDSGADATVISDVDYKMLKNCPKLAQPKKKLIGPGRVPLIVFGEFTGQLSYGKNQSEQKIYVAEDIVEPLLGRPAVDALKMLKWTESINSLSENPYDAYPELFRGLGKMKNIYKIQLKENAQPFSLTTSRRIALPLREKVKEELTKLQEAGIISQVTKPTEWCAGLVVVPKPNKEVRLCVDLTHLNRAVKRERITLPSVDETLGQITGAKWFSKLDANSGFHQMMLAKESSLLTTFITPFGRFCFNRLPFGICSASEVYHREMNHILEGLEGVICHIDDVLIHGRTKEEHDERLQKVLGKLKQAGVTLNNKCVFGTNKVKFLGHHIGADGIRTDPDKVRAITLMEAPTSVTELRRFLGMMNFLGKFLPNLAEITRPLRELLKKDTEFIWDQTQEHAFNKIKNMIVTAPVLALYDPNKELSISADASSFGLGAVLEQKEESTWKPIAYASRTMTETEQRLAQIEKEALAITWACDRFSEYILGKSIWINTDHKPLVQILGNKSLDEMSPRLQRFRMRLMRYDYTIKHVAGKSFYTPDTLSRAPLKNIEEPQDLAFINEVERYAQHVVDQLPVTDKRIEEIKNAQNSDPIMNILKMHISQGFPARPEEIDIRVRDYWKIRGELTVQRGLIMKGQRMVIPAGLRKEILRRIHEGHMGIVKCRKRAQGSVYWPGISNEVKKMVEECEKYFREKPNHREPLMPSECPQRPWEVVASDIAERDRRKYLVITDYYSRFPEVFLLENTTSDTIIQKCKSAFSRHGIPKQLKSDNGPQYSCKEFKQFATEYGFHHVTSSPYYPQSNGLVEAAVKSIKSIIKRSEDPYLGLLAYRNTPLIDLGHSPAELLMGRRLRSTLPVTSASLKPRVVNSKKFQVLNGIKKDRQKSYYDQSHRASSLSNLQQGQRVWVQDLQREGKITSLSQTPRSYWVATPQGNIRRNRIHLCPSLNKIMPEEANDKEEETTPDRKETITTPLGSKERDMRSTPKGKLIQDQGQQEQDRTDQVRTRSGRSVRPPQKLDL